MILRELHYWYLFRILYACEKFGKRPDVICDACGHAGRHSYRRVHSTEVVPRNPKRHTRLVIRQLAAVRVCPANVAAKVSPNGEIQPFNV